METNKTVSPWIACEYQGSLQYKSPAATETEIKRPSIVWFARSIKIIKAFSA